MPFTQQQQRRAIHYISLTKTIDDRYAFMEKKTGEVFTDTLSAYLYDIALHKFPDGNEQAKFFLKDATDEYALCLNLNSKYVCRFVYTLANESIDYHTPIDIHVRMVELKESAFPVRYPSLMVCQKGTWLKQAYKKHDLEHLGNSAEAHIEFVKSCIQRIKSKLPNKEYGTMAYANDFAQSVIPNTPKTEEIPF